MTVPEKSSVLSLITCVRTMNREREAVGIDRGHEGGTVVCFEGAGKRGARAHRAAKRGARVTGGEQWGNGGQGRWGGGGGETGEKCSLWLYGADERNMFRLLCPYRVNNQ